MMVRSIDPSSWLFATVRTLLRRIHVLEEGVNSIKPFKFSAKSPDFVPGMSDYQFATFFMHLFYHDYDRSSHTILCLDELVLNLRTTRMCPLTISLVQLLPQ